MTAPEPLTELLTRLERLHGEAAPGPWFNEFLYEVSFQKPEEEREIIGDDGIAQVCLIDTHQEFGDERAEATTELIVELRNALPRLISELRARMEGV